MSPWSRRDSLKLALAALASPVMAGPAFPQSKFPERPIKLIVPRAPGGPLDLVARQWAEQMKGSLGSVIVENLGGGGGVIGTQAAARAEPDGYTIALLGAGELVVNPAIRPAANFNPGRDLAPISIFANLTSGIAVAAAHPARTLKAFASDARGKPKLSYGSAGTGTMSHLAGELFKQLAGLPEVVHVPYKGSAPAFVDLMAGNIDMMAFTVSGETIEMHKAGKIRILAVGSAQRIAALPDVPTGADAGFPDFVAGNFLGFFAPSKTPDAVLGRIAAATGQAVADPQFASRMAQQAYELIATSSPSEAATFVNREVARWTPLIQASGLVKG